MWKMDFNYQKLTLNNNLTINWVNVIFRKNYKPYSNEFLCLSDIFTACFKYTCSTNNSKIDINRFKKLHSKLGYVFVNYVVAQRLFDEDSLSKIIDYLQSECLYSIAVHQRPNQEFVTKHLLHSEAASVYLGRLLNRELIEIIDSLHLQKKGLSITTWNSLSKNRDLNFIFKYLNYINPDIVFRYNFNCFLPKDILRLKFIKKYGKRKVYFHQACPETSQIYSNCPYDVLLRNDK